MEQVLQRKSRTASVIARNIGGNMEEQKFELDLRMSDKGIVCNAATLKAMLPEKLKSYNYVVDAENYDNAKKDRTRLNDFHDLLQKKRLQFEKIELASWKNQKDMLKDIEKTIEKASDALGDGIKAIDEADKIAKMERIRENFNELKLPLPITFEQLYDCKEYGKKSKSEKSILVDMQKKINKIVSDSKLMALFLPTDLVEQEQIKRVYCNTLDIDMAKEKADELAKLHEKVAKNPIDTSNLKQNVSKCESQERKNDQLYTRTFRVVDCTRQQIIDLGNYMNANGIKFEKVEEK